MSKRFHCSKTICMTLCSLIMLTSFIFFAFSLAALHKYSYVTALLGTNVFIYGIVILLLVTAFSIVLAPSVLYAVILQRQSLLSMLTFSTLTVGSMSVLVCVLGFCLRSELNEGVLHSWMMDGLQREYGHSDDFHVTQAWNRLQKEMDCCGVDSTTEWITSDWYMGQIRFPRRRKPHSCCRSCGNAYDKFCKSQTYQLMTMKERLTCEMVHTRCERMDDNDLDRAICSGQKLTPEGIMPDVFVHSQGCFPILENRLYFYSFILITVGFVLALLLFIESFSAFVLIYSSDPIMDYDEVNTQDR